MLMECHKIHTRYVINSMNKIKIIYVVALVVLLLNLTVSNSQTLVLVKDIVNGSGDSSPQYLTVFDNHLYFGTVFTSGLWKSDGTDSGTVLAEGTSISNDSAFQLGVFKDQLYFSTFSNRGWWSTTGGINNATLIKDQINTLGELPYSSTVLGEEVLVFAASDYSLSGNPSKLFRSDMTTVGTITIGNFNSTNGNTLPRMIGEIDSKLLFSAVEIGEGRELYSTDATTATTGLFKDIKPGVIGGLSSVFGVNQATLDGEFYFPGWKTNGQGLWKTDGTPVGTVELDDLSVVYSNPSYLKVFNNSLYFFSDNIDPPNQLYKLSAGSSVPVQLTNKMAFSDEGCTAYESFEFDGYLYFPYSDNSTGCELWRTDGTAVNTTMVKDINLGVTNIHSHPKFKAELDGWLYFIALKEGFGFELWKTDGSQSGTTMVADLNPGPDSGVNGVPMKIFNGELYFVGDDGVHGKELFKLQKEDNIFEDGFEDVGPI